MAENRYDPADLVRRVFLMNAGGLKFASYRVRDMAQAAAGVSKFSTLQHHLTYVPVQSMGMRDDGVEQVLVNEIGATVCAILEDEQARYLGEVIEQIETGYEITEPRAFVDLGNHFVIHVYPHPTTGNLDFQVFLGSVVLGVFSLTIAKLIVTLAEQARGGPGGLRGDPKPDAGPIAGEVDKATRAPSETITAASLDD